MPGSSAGGIGGNFFAPAKTFDASIRVFHKHKKLTILASEALLCETKNSNIKMLPLVRIEPGTYDFKSDTLLLS